MSNVIVYTNENGGVAICVPTGELPIEQVQSRDIPAGVPSFIVRHDTLPVEDNDFYDAWEQNKGAITINLNKAKEVTKRRLRSEREPLLAAEDVKFMRAQEAGSDTSDIVAEKQRLRDVTKAADTCATLAELRALKAAKE